MILNTHPENRKEMVKAICELTGMIATYLFTPTYAYQVGPITISRDGSIDCEDEAMIEAIKPMLIERGWLEAETQDEMPVEIESPADSKEMPEAVDDISVEQMDITMPIPGWTVAQLTNLLRMLFSKQNLINRMLLTESCFLTLDGRNGMFFQALYPGYVQAEDGSVTLVTSTSGAYEDPVYDILSVSGGVTTPVLAFPDETLTIGDVSFTLLDPVSYPGLRIKHMHTEILGMLYATFVLIVAALYLCFFMVPVAVKVTESGYAVLSPKTQTGLMIELEALLKEEA